MTQLYGLLNLDQRTAPPALRHRAWFHLGIPIVLAPEISLTLFADRTGEHYRVNFELRHASERYPRYVGAMPPRGWLSLHPCVPVRVIPRATRYTGDRPDALLMELAGLVVAAGDAVRSDL